jgi:hypothetical protein
VDAVMGEVRARVRARLREDLARVDPASPLLTSHLLDDAEALYRRALERRRLLMLPALLLDEDEWELNTSLRLTSHRRVTGRVVLFLKRRLVLPIVRWLYEFSRDNFERQARVNDTLMATIETLVVEVVALRREVEALKSGRHDQAATPGR